MRQLVLRIAATALALAAAGNASAQNPFPYNTGVPNPAAQFQRPPVLSPFLNLNNRGNPAINYFNFVAPQMQANQGGYGGFQNQPLPALQAGDDISLDPHDPTSRIPRPAGHQTAFMNTGGFFNSLGTIGAAGRPGSAGGAGAAGFGAPTGRRR